jgi:hypothetical protein
MYIRRITIAGAYGVGLAALSFSTAEAQYYPPCSPFPLEWPFCVVAGTRPHHRINEAVLLVGNVITSVRPKVHVHCPFQSPIP